MKKIFLLTIVGMFSLSTVIWAQNKKTQTGTCFSELSLQDAITKANKGKKKRINKIFVDCYTKWCAPCRMMSQTVFPQKEVGDFLNSNFINLKIDLEEGEGIELAKRYGVDAFPTFLILDASGSEIGRVVGGGDAGVFLDKIKFAMDPKNSIENLTAKFRKEKNIEVGKLLVRVLKEGNFDYSAIVNELYTLVDESQKYEKEFFIALCKSISSPIDPILCNIVMNRNKAEHYMGKEFVDSCLKDYYYDYLYKAGIWLEMDDKSEQEIIEAAKGMGRFNLDGRTQEAYIGAFALYIKQKQYDQLISYFEDCFYELPMSEMKNYINAMRFVMAKANNEQQEKFLSILNNLLSRTNDTVKTVQKISEPI